jgi:hypothetical protein
MKQINYDKKYLDTYHSQKTTGESYAELALAFIATIGLFAVLTLLIIGMAMITN